MSANHVVDEGSVTGESASEQLSMFVNYEEEQKKSRLEAEAMQEEKQVQQALLDIKKKFGKNAILKGMNLQEGATARSKNSQIGGHKA